MDLPSEIALPRKLNKEMNDAWYRKETILAVNNKLYIGCRCDKDVARFDSHNIQKRPPQPKAQVQIAIPMEVETDEVSGPI